MIANDRWQVQGDHSWRWNNCEVGTTTTIPGYWTGGGGSDTITSGSDLYSAYFGGKAYNMSANKYFALLQKYLPETANVGSLTPDSNGVYSTITNSSVQRGAIAMRKSRTGALKIQGGAGDYSGQLQMVGSSGENSGSILMDANNTNTGGKLTFTAQGRVILTIPAPH